MFWQGVVFSMVETSWEMASAPPGLLVVGLTIYTFRPLVTNSLNTVFSVIYSHLSRVSTQKV